MQDAPPATPAKTTSGLAIASLVTGLTCVWPAAIICGHIALSKIKKSSGQIGGAGMAIAGLILGYLSLALIALWVITIVTVGAGAWKKGSERAQCIMNQQVISAQLEAYCLDKNLKPGDPLEADEALESGTNTSCPSGAQLVITPVVPEQGQPFVSCPFEDGSGHSHSLTTEYDFGDSSVDMPATEE